MNNKQTSRRDFCKTGLVVLGSLPVLAAVGHSRGAYAQGAPTTALDENDPQAQALGYKHDGKAVDTAKFPKKAGAEGAKQSCANCMLMQSTGMKVPGKDGEWGRCSIFMNGLVNVNGWCNTWAAKPA